MKIPPDFFLFSFRKLQNYPPQIIAFLLPLWVKTRAINRSGRPAPVTVQVELPTFYLPVRS